MSVLVLASGSPRRAQLLRAAGIRFDVHSPLVDETLRPGEEPAPYVERLALDKAQSVAARYSGRIVLGADTTVVGGGRILGKPVDADDAAHMLAELAGRSHEVLTAVALVGAGEPMVALERTTVWVEPMTTEDIRRYVETGEPLDKAGAYAIQGRFSRFVQRINGSYTNVVGLPVALVYRLLLQYPEGRRTVRSTP